MQPSTQLSCVEGFYMLIGIKTRKKNIYGNCSIEEIIVGGNKTLTVVCGNYAARSYDKVIFKCDNCDIETFICKRNFFYQKKNLNMLCESCSSKKTSLEKYGVESPNKSAIIKLKQHACHSNRKNFVDGNEHRKNKTTSYEELCKLRSINAKNHWENGVYNGMSDIWSKKSLARMNDPLWKNKWLIAVNTDSARFKKSIATKKKWMNDPEYKRKMSHLGIRISKFQKDVYSTLGEDWEMEYDIPGTTLTVDIFNSKTKEIIECYGDYWHCNPKKFSENYFHKRIKKTANEIWNDDKNRIQLLENLGYKIKIIWESDWKLR